MGEHTTEFDDLWTEAPLGYTPPPGRIIMCLGEASCDAPYRGENGTRYYCRRPPGHADAAGHDCPADREDRAPTTEVATRTSGEPVDLLAALQRSIDAAKGDDRG